MRFDKFSSLFILGVSTYFADFWETKKKNKHSQNDK